MESEPVIPCFRSWIWYYNTTTSAPELPSAKHTYKNILLEIAPDGVHSSPFAKDDETHFAVWGGPVSSGGYWGGLHQRSNVRGCKNFPYKEFGLSKGIADEDVQGWGTRHWV